MKMNTSSLALFVLLISTTAIATAVFAGSNSIQPNADGSVKQWLTSPATTTHFTLVDENPCNNNTDYIFATSTGAIDSFKFNLNGIPNGTNVTGTSIILCGANTSLGATTYVVTDLIVDGVWRGSNTTTFSGTTFVTFTKTLSGTSTAIIPFTKVSTTNLEIRTTLVSPSSTMLKVSRLRPIFNW